MIMYSVSHGLQRRNRKPDQKKSSTSTSKTKHETKHENHPYGLAWPTFLFTPSFPYPALVLKLSETPEEQDEREDEAKEKKKNSDLQRPHERTSFFFFVYFFFFSLGGRGGAGEKNPPEQLQGRQADRQANRSGGGQGLSLTERSDFLGFSGEEGMNERMNR